MSFLMCPICLIELDLDNMSRDHMIPLSRGGPDERSNIVYMCKRCNNLKGLLTLEEFEKLQEFIHFEDIARAVNSIISTKVNRAVATAPRSNLIDAEELTKTLERMLKGLHKALRKEGDILPRRISISARISVIKELLMVIDQKRLIYDQDFAEAFSAAIEELDSENFN